MVWRGFKVDAIKAGQKRAYVDFGDFGIEDLKIVGVFGRPERDGGFVF